MTPGDFIVKINYSFVKVISQTQIFLEITVDPETYAYSIIYKKEIIRKEFSGHHRFTSIFGR